MIHLVGISITDSKVALTQELLETSGIPIPEDSTFDEGTISFAAEFDARKWIRENAELFPREITSISAYSVFMDTIKSPKGVTFQKKGNITRWVQSLIEIRTPNPELYKQSRKENDEELYTEEDNFDEL